MRLVGHKINGTIYLMVASFRTEVYKSSLSVYNQLVVAITVQER